MVKAVVLGAGGFIGGHLVTKLKSLNYWVRGVDIKWHEFRETDADEFIIADLRDLSKVETVIDSTIDIVFQLAADMGGSTYINTGENDCAVMYNSCQINLNVLKVCENITKQQTHKIQTSYKKLKIFYASSACVYPEHNQLNPESPECAEDSTYPADPDSEYGWEKLFSERLYKVFAKDNPNLEIRIGRFHNIYGPYGTYEGGKEKAPAAICRKVALASNNDKIEVYGDGKQTRSFLYVSECVEAIMRMIDSDFIGPLNIGSDEMISINDFTKMIIKLSNKNLEIENIPSFHGIGVRGRNSDNKLIKEKLGWVPNYSLEKGIKETYEWIKEVIN
jgi:nucleoside-diphosphate-sugar epimerase